MDGEKFNLEQFPTSESAMRMLSYVSQGFYDNSYVGKWLYQVMGLEYDKARELVGELPYQMFPETATWGLMYHELKWQLPVKNNLSDDERRNLIYQKRDTKAPMTPYRMELYLKNTTAYNVCVSDVNDAGPYNFKAPHPNIFRVYVFDQETLNSKLIHEALKKVKQSHTSYVVNQRIDVIAAIHSFTDKLVNVKCLVKLPVQNEMLVPTVGMRFPMQQITEDIENVVVEERRNLWYLDGKVKLDGSHKLNAMYRKEEL